MISPFDRMTQLARDANRFAKAANEAWNNAENRTTAWMAVAGELGIGLSMAVPRAGMLIVMIYAVLMTFTNRAIRQDRKAVEQVIKEWRYDHD